MGGGKGGGSGSSVNVAPSPYETELANIARDLYSSTADIRKALLGDYAQILGVGSGRGNTAATYQTISPALLPGGGQSTGTQMKYYADSSGKLYPQTMVTTNTGSSFLDAITGRKTPISYSAWTPDDTMVPVTPSSSVSQGSSPMFFSAGGAAGGANQTGRYDPTQLPTYAPLFGLQKQSLEAQYQNAKNALMGSVPRGGNMAGALTGLEASRAASMGALPAELSSGIVADMLNKAYGAAFQTPTQTMSGLGAAAGTYGNRAAAAMAQDAANQQSTYGLFGQIGGAVGEGIGKAFGDK